MPNDSIARKLQAMNWHHAPEDLDAVAILESRLATWGRQNKPITYSELVQGVEFTLDGGEKHIIDIHAWTGRDQQIIGIYLGYISMRSYLAHGFMASALAVDALEMKASKGFHALMRDCGALGKQDKETFWLMQFKLAHEHFRNQPAPLPLPTASEFFEYRKTVLEGIATTLSTTVRSRCDALREIARQHYRSSDGLLRCLVCGWAKPSSEIKGDIVELHHRNPLGDAPPEGRELTTKEAVDSLAPLCPNCHRIAHAKPSGGVFSIDELRQFLSQSNPTEPK